MVNNLQIIIHSPLINVQFPGNAFMIYEVMITVATFDILPTDDWFPLVLTQLPEEDAYTDKFDRMDYGSPFTVMNMGTMFLIFLYYVMLYTIYPCFDSCGRHIKCSKKCAKTLRKMLFWNHAIVFLQEGLLEILLVTAINFIYIHEAEAPWDNWNLVLNNVVSIVLTVGIAILFLTIVFYLWPKGTLIRRKKYRRRYGSVYSMIKVKRSNYAMLYPIFFFLRRILLVFAVVFMLDYPTFQIFLFIFPTLLVMIHIGEVRPLLWRYENRLEIYNSFTILCLTYCLLCYTNFVSDAHARYQMGFAMIFLTSQNILINIFLLGREPVKMLILSCKRRWNRRTLYVRKTKYLISKLKSTKKSLSPTP